MSAIRAEGLSKLYRRTSAGFKMRTLKSALLDRSLVRGLRPGEAVTAIESLSFEVPAGEAFGVIGGNGSGKSTLLKLVAGLLQPTSGKLAVDGRVAALIELGAGFHPEISGRENVFINGSILGLSRSDIERRYDEIVEFSGLGDFIEEPVKNYSSGMYVRLGFAVAIHTDPEVLLVDEVLAVGDEQFAHRCLAKIEEHLGRGRTLMVVSHSLDLVESLCDRVLWLEKGHSQGVGEPRRMIDAYREQVAAEEGRAHLAEKKRDEEEAPEDRWGSGQARIESTRLLVGGEERYDFATGDAVAFEISARCEEPLDDFVFGVAVSTPRGMECWGTNTDLAGFEPERWQGAATVRLRCPELRLAPGEYLVDVAVHSRSGAPYDYRKGVFRLTVRARDRGVGVYFPQHDWQLEGLRVKPPRAEET
ncbi:MAG: ABC transporter ATP-binding protein [Acidobacteriota bacterium]